MCPAPNGIVCDDGDPCTDDACVAGICESTDKTGLDAVTCTCDRPLAAVCVGQTIPRVIQKSTTRACRLFAAAVDAKPRRQRRELRQGARALRRAVSAAIRAQLRGLAPECAAALSEQYQDAADRASLAADQL